MKLYVVHLPVSRPFSEVRDNAKRVSPYCMVTVVNEGRSFEFQDELAAKEVARVFDGKIDIIEYDVKSLMK